MFYLVDTFSTTMCIRHPTLSGVLLLLAICHADDDNSIFKHAKDTLALMYGEIIFSAVVFRNTDRRAGRNLPDHQPETLFEPDEARLTPTGKIRAQNLGRWTRMRYDHLIGNEPYDTELLSMISTHSRKVVFCGQLFLAGFHRPNLDGPEGDTPWRVDPVAIGDRMMAMQENCARYNLEVEAVKTIPLFVQFHEASMELYQAINASGLTLSFEDPIITTAKVFVLHDTISATDPEALLRSRRLLDFYVRTRESSVMFFRLQTFNHTMKRLKAGPLLGHIVNELRSKRDQPQSKKRFQFYSGQDCNVVGLLHTLNIWDFSLVPHSAALFFELRILNGVLIVTVLYRGNDSSPPLLMNIPYCPNPCSLDDFMKFTTQSFIPENWEEECDTNRDGTANKPNYNALLFNGW